MIWEHCSNVSKTCLTLLFLLYSYHNLWNVYNFACLFSFFILVILFVPISFHWPFAKFHCHQISLILYSRNLTSELKKNFHSWNREILLQRNFTLEKFYPIKVVWWTLIFSLFWLMMKFLAVICYKFFCLI